MPLVITGVLLAGAVLPRPHRLTFDVGTRFGIGFRTWLQFRSKVRSM